MKIKRDYTLGLEHWIALNKKKISLCTNTSKQQNKSYLSSTLLIVFYFSWLTSAFLWLTEEHEESVYNTFISEIRNFRMRLEGHEEQLIRQIRTPLDRDDVQQSIMRIAEQEVLTCTKHFFSVLTVQQFVFHVSTALLTHSFFPYLSLLEEENRSGPAEGGDWGDEGEVWAVS